MPKLTMQSPNIVDKNIEKIRELFPGCITENRDNEESIRYKVDFELLRQELSDHIAEGAEERYHLNWPGKKKAILAANSPIRKTLRPCREESVHFDTTKNLFIEGDNLEALKLIRETYLGKIKMIYIDPPYNTGNDFIYNDDFSENSAEFLQRSNLTDEMGNRLVHNPDSAGRFHSNWLTMMMPRLRLARTLLSRDGAIFVSCDEGEHPRLRLLMDEVFGQSNFISDLVWAAGRKNNSKLISVSHEYIVCYARDREYLKEYLRDEKTPWRQQKHGLDKIYAKLRKLKKVHKDDYDSMTAEMKKWYKNLDDGHPSKAHSHYFNIDKQGLYFAQDISPPGGGRCKIRCSSPEDKEAR